METKTLTTILEQAVQAPSGDNSQPWHFVWSETDQVLSLYNLPDNDNPIFNYKQRGSLIAHGALLENIKLLAGTAGYRIEVELRADSAHDNLIARIKFIETTKVEDTLLASYIDQRSTNRKPYQTRPLTTTERAALLHVDTEGITLTLEHTEAGKEQLARAVSTAERVMLQYKPLHDYFFDMIRWTSAQEQKKGSGLYVKTMELLPPQLLIFKLYSFWPIARILNRLNLPAFIATENAKIYKRASAFILFTNSEHTAESYIKLGSVLQRIWLTATSLGLSMQPVAGVVYLSQRLANEPDTKLSNNQSQLVTDASENIATVFKTPVHSLRMLVRIGQAEPPSARARKHIPTIKII